MHAPTTMGSSSVMNRGKTSALQILTLVLCFLVVATDGFDVASISYVAPLLKKAWMLTPPMLGQIFGAGLLGLTIGSFIFGPLADRIGRRRVIVMSMVLFAIGSIACAYADSPNHLAILRLLTGIGLGGAMPTAITLSSEFCPDRNRSLLVTLMFAGFTIGLAFGGFLAAVLIPSYGWQGVFICGGVVPLVLAPFIWILLPESLKFMAGKKKYEAEAQKVLFRLTGSHDVPLDDAIADERDATSASGKTGIVATLFSKHYRSGTLLLWLAFFCTLWVYYQVSSWLPTVITASGVAVTKAATIGMMMPIGGTIGSLINAKLMDRFNPFIVLTFSYIVAAVAIASIGSTISHPDWLYTVMFFVGLGLSGAQTGANVLVSGFYTTTARATGVSWALAVGRIGSIFGSMTGGMILAALGSVEIGFYVFALPTIVAAIAMLLNGVIYKDSHGVSRD